MTAWSVAGLTAMLLVAVTTQSLWLGPVLRAYVRHVDGREVSVASARVGLDADWQPTVRFTGLEVENASWVKVPAPLIQAGELDATFSWTGLLQNPCPLTRLVLRDAQVDLELRSDGLRNWRLMRPGDTAKGGRITVLIVEAQRSKLRVRNGVIDLDLSLSTEGNPQEFQSLVLQGLRRGVGFEGRLQAAPAVTLYNTGAWFALEGEVHTAHARLEVKGRARDLMQLGGLEGDVHASGDQLVELSEVLSRSPWIFPAGRVDARAHLQKLGPHWALRDLVAEGMDGDVSGSLDFTNRASEGARSLLDTHLVSRRLDGPDLAARLALAMKEAPSVAGAASAASAPRARPDLDIDWRVAAMAGLPVAMSQTHAVVTARNELWQMRSFDSEIAGGRVRGEASLEWAMTPRRLAARLNWSNVQLGQIFRGLSASRASRTEGDLPVDGRIDGSLAMQTQGDKLPAMLSSASGELSASLAGASIPATIEAKLGLDGGRWLMAFLKDKDRRQVTCAQIQVRIDSGQAVVQRLGVETDALLVDGLGRIDLGSRSLDLMLTPYRKKQSIFSLDKSVRISGPISSPSFSVVGTPPEAHRVPCVVVKP